MVKRHVEAAPAENAYAKKAFEAIRQIEEEASRKKTEQLTSLRQALQNIEDRISESTGQREQVEQAIATISGKPAGRRPRTNYDDVRRRLLRWLGSHAGEWYTAGDLRHEFPELAQVASIAVFLKSELAEGKVRIDKTGGNRNTKYTGNMS
jgi:hypothetical protein